MLKIKLYQNNEKENRKLLSLEEAITKLKSVGGDENESKNKNESTGG